MAAEHLEAAVHPLRDKVVVITGAAQGIGLCIAQFFAREGSKVMLADIQAEKAAREAGILASRGHTAASTFVDVGDPLSAEAMIDLTLTTFGGVDVLVNNGAIDAPPGYAPELTNEEWRQVIDIDLSGQWWCTKAVLPHMIERESGRIIFITSSSARIGDSGVSVAYNAAKAGLIGLTIGLSVQLEAHGILVNGIAPGATGTGRITDEWRDAYLKDHPLGLGGPEPVAHACLYLAGPSGDWVSGAILNVSGGRWRA